MQTRSPFRVAHGIAALASLLSAAPGCASEATDGSAPRSKKRPPAELAAVAVSHLLDDTPTEMHVWAALNYQTPLRVTTEHDNWMVDETGAIARLD